jgi:hypothetical protein
LCVAVDCGVCVNPAGVTAQMEGAVGFGLSAALHGELALDAGKVVQSNFHDHPLLRLPEMPVVEVHIVQNHEKPGGAGEPRRSASRSRGRQRSVRGDWSEGEGAAATAEAVGEGRCPALR